MGKPDSDASDPDYSEFLLLVSEPLKLTYDTAADISAAASRFRADMEYRAKLAAKGLKP